MELTDNWIMTKWNADEVDFAKNPTCIVNEHEKLLKEILECEGNPRKTVLPTQVEIANNILTTAGLAESAKRDTGETSTTITHVGLGTSSTAEAECKTSISFSRTAQGSESNLKVWYVMGRFSCESITCNTERSRIIYCCNKRYHARKSSIYRFYIKFWRSFRRPDK